MSKHKTNPLYYFLLLLLLSSCTSEEESVVQKTKDVSSVTPIELPTIITPEFNADSAFFFIESQVNFGPRIPNTKEHIACSDWLQSTPDLRQPTSDLLSNQLQICSRTRVYFQLGPYLLCGQTCNFLFTNELHSSSRFGTQNQ